MHFEKPKVPYMSVHHKLALVLESSTPRKPQASCTPKTTQGPDSSIAPANMAGKAFRIIQFSLQAPWLCITPSRSATLQLNAASHCWSDLPSVSTEQLRDGYGVLTIVAITLFACLTSCCAIVSTRAFLVNESCDARRADSVLGMHERRHRLLQSLQSLRPSAAPPHPPHLKPKTNYKPWRQLVIDSPLEGDRLGVNLTEDLRFL